ncbi:NrtA/SsuA/CpmA family ABC transporter substrate-binding protein [soil metagenome]
MISIFCQQSWRDQLRMFASSTMQNNLVPVQRLPAGPHSRIRVAAVFCFASVIAITLLSPPGVAAEPHTNSNSLATRSATLNLGVQPLGYPSGVISAVMQHDRILQKALAESKFPLKTYPFKRGADMLTPLADHRLDAALLGDMPTLIAAATATVSIIGLVKQSSTAIVAKRETEVRGLLGKRIGYVEASSGHYTLLQGLASAGIDDTKVTLIPLSVNEMPAALERGDIDAFAAWEPAPTVALANNKQNHVVFRGWNSDYFIITQDFIERAPQAALHLIAGFIRAIEWMRRSQNNAEKAAHWASAETAHFSPATALLSTAQITAITRREILDIPSAPAILHSPSGSPLQNEFQFLTKLGKLPPAATWENINSALHYDGLAKVLSEPRAFKLRVYDYDE